MEIKWLNDRDLLSYPQSRDAITYKNVMKFFKPTLKVLRVLKIYLACL